MKNRSRQLVAIATWIILVTVALLVPGAEEARAQGSGPAYNLDQCRNGGVSTPQTALPCIDTGTGATGWVNGNAGESNSHYAEGGSIIYRNRLDGLTSGTQYTLVMSYAHKHSGHHAIDYLTHANRPATPPNVVDACSGWMLNTTTPAPKDTITCPMAVLNPPIPSAGTYAVSAFTIPSPALCKFVGAPPPADSLGYSGAPDVLQPCTSYADLITDETIAAAQMYLIGGTIQSLTIGEEQGDLTDAQAFSRIVILFTPTNPTGRVVFTWGGHIGSRLDWGFIDVALTDPASAGGISGSPYHMDSKGLCAPTDNGFGLVTCDVGGDQDRSLSAAAVVNPASITIIKTCVNGTGPNFTFDVTQPASAITPDPFQLACDAQKATTGITAFGNYTIQETSIPAGWSLTNIVCGGDSNLQVGSDGDFDTGDTSVVIDLDPGENVTCTYTNTLLQGRLKIVKQCFGSAVGDDFDFTVTVGPTPVDPQNLLCGGETAFIPVNTGTYTVTETAVNSSGPDLADWGTTVQCVGANNTLPSSPAAPGSLGRIGTAGVDPAEDVTCTYVNTKKAKITIEKVCVGGTEATFTYNLQRGADAATHPTVACGGNNIVVPLTADTADFVNWTIGEQALAGWALTKIECSSGGGDTSDNEVTAIVGLDAGENVLCIFTNSKPDAQIDVSPLNAENPVGEPHTITATVQQNDNLAPPAGDGTDGWNPAPDGTLVTFSLNDNTANAEFVGGVNTCTTTGGSCSIQITSDTPGGVDIHATTTFSVLGVSLTRETDGLGNNSDDAHKDYVAGSITIRKISIGGVGTFSYTGDLDPFDLTTVTAGAAVEHVFDNLAPGPFAVTEGGPPAGWAFTLLECTGDPDVSIVGQTATIDLDAGEAVVCTYTNTKNATVRVVKNTIGGDATFSYDVSGTLNGQGTPAFADPFQIQTVGLTGTTATTTFSNLPAAGQSLIFNEGALTGWDFTLLQISGDGGSSIVGDVATLDVDPGETIVVTYTNTKRATLFIEKESLSAESACASFSFNSNDFSLDTCTDLDGAANDDDLTDRLVSTGPLSVAPSATYNFTEDGEFGWGLFNIACTTAAGVPNLAESTVAITPAPGEVVTCRFTNTQAAMPLIKLFNGTAPTCDIGAPVAITNITFGGIGSSFVVTVPGIGIYHNGDVVQITGVTGTEANSVNGNFFVDGLVEGGGNSTFTLLNSKNLFNVAPVISGFGAVALVAPCTHLDVSPVPQFEFRLFAPTTPGAPVEGFAAGYVGSAVVPPQADLPGITNVGFTICEMNPGLGGNGWSLSGVTITVTAFDGTVTGPTPLSLYSADDGGGNVGICFDGFIPPGTETWEISANNTKPGGTRTIGYWANWTTCDGKGNQVTVAENNGGTANGFWLLDDVLGFLDVGLVVFPPTTYDADGNVITNIGCATAVDLLKKEDIGPKFDVVGEGEKRANDAAYGMAAQLIAAEANYGAGALQCTNATDATKQAQDLLDAISFDGTGSFLPPQQSKSENLGYLTNYSAVRNYALQLAGVLDAYNNLHDVGDCSLVPAPPSVVPLTP